MRAYAADPAVPQYLRYATLYKPSWTQVLGRPATNRLSIRLSMAFKGHCLLSTDTFGKFVDVIFLKEHEVRAILLLPPLLSILQEEDHSRSYLL